MCGIIGLRCSDNEISGMIFEELLQQSQIRGKHATGIAYLNNGNIESESRPISADKFINITEVPDSEFIIGHTRYSTSDLHYNQPMVNRKMAIVHNGVITQEHPKDWFEHYKYTDFETKNDSELLLKCLSDDNIFVRKLLFKKFNKASIACGVLETEKMYCFRNTKRPLWYFDSVWEIDGKSLFSGFASTASIIRRTFDKLDIPISFKEVEPFTKYIFNSNGKIEKVSMNEPTDEISKLEYQKPTKIESKYV